MRTHLVLRTYIAEARNERREPEVYSDDLMKVDALSETPELDTICWDEPKEIAKIVYKALGYTAREQFDLGIVAQPYRTHNWLICAKLRKAFGDLSDVAGFDAQGNFIRDRYSDILRAVFDGRHIVRLEGVSSRQLVRFG